MPRLPDSLFCPCLLAICVLVSGCKPAAPPSADTSARATNASTSVTTHRPAVRTVAVMQQQLRRTTAQPGTVHAYYEAELRARVGGYVKQLQADIGDVVESGDVLATIAVPEMIQRKAVMQARVVRNQARETQAEAGVELADANVRSANAQRQQSISEATSAEASVVAAEAEFQRTSDLVGRQSLQQRVLDEVTMRRDAAKAQLTAARSAIQSTEAEVVVAEAKFAAAKADLLAARAETEIAKRELEEAEVMLAYAEIRAPFAGVVTQRHIDLGDLVTADDNPAAAMSLFVISRVDKVRIRVPVPEADAAWVNPGDPIQWTFPAFPGESIEATVTRVSGSLEADTRTMLVESEVENPDRKLVPGMFAMASITLAVQPDVSVLPARAIRFDETGNAYVYVLQPDETVSMMEIETGVDEGSWIEVVSPLEPGQLVVDAHRDRFQDGQAVRVLPSE